MSLFAIVKNADNSVEQFSIAANAAAAIADFTAVGGYIAANYTAHDATLNDGFPESGPPRSATGQVWAYDQGTNKLVQIAAAPDLPDTIQHWLKSPDGSAWEVTIDDLGNLVTTKVTP